uniref:non-specific serine/threonine protein kinase n=1 Tax=Anopheles coluzzii TaxID=1518534 RepID=A0A8W7NZV5_ANOCL
MGNQLVALAPSQIFPVEHYLTGTFEFDLQFEKSMGSTRFMKVAKVKVDEGPAVVKVFVRHDPSLPLEQHLERIEHIKKHLANAVNCLPFQKVLTMEKACLIVRQYVKHSLYDRVSTRPFLTLIEKKWITFQILCALHQCHKQRICHGDIKLENILITSWNWVLLSDFASFKPTYLPEDNPADYSYFFDTSRRRTCYIAPERFVRSSSGESIQPKDGPLVGDGQYCAGQLLPEMDIFSAGCALLELWTEGTAPFEFSQLLAYRRGEVDLVRKHLDGIENERLRQLVESMLSPDPRDRKSAELYLDQERGKLFPEYFYAFLQSYLQMFSTVPVVPPDEKVTRLHGDIGQIVQILTGGGGGGGGGDDPPEPTDDDDDDDGLILITGVITSCIRGLSFCRSKLLALEILQALAENTTSETILDRILPYILHLAQDAAPRVRVCSLNTLTRCLRLVRQLPRSDANVFPEYILPAIAPLATDHSTFVRMTYARNIATLADTAVSFLEQSQHTCTSENVPPPHYETELSALHEMLHQTVLSLLTDAQSAVKQTLMTSGITQLCVFFGRQKANDVILSHMITFLNDKEDRHLRGAFFDCIVGVASYVGWHCAPMLLPLLQQGLTDPEEFVIAKAIHATTLLVELGLIQKQGTIEFIGECACYLAHPNLWIRHEVVELVATAARILTAIDVQCKVRPSIAAHLRLPLIELACPELLLDCLVPPVPRNFYDAIDTNSSKMALQQARHFEADTRYTSASSSTGELGPDDGPVVEMHPLDQGAQSVIVYATLYGALVGWDIRMPDYAWRLQSDLRSGVITTFCIDPSSSWLTVGTSSGRHVCWDLRFQLPIAEIKHPHDARIRRVSHHPTESSWLVSASQGNSEVYVWNIETGHRQQAYWASASPPLSNSNASSHSVCALLPGVNDGNPFLLTGGTDQRLRYWDPVNIENCALVVPSARDYAPLNVTYE